MAPHQHSDAARTAPGRLTPGFRPDWSADRTVYGPPSTVHGPRLLVTPMVSDYVDQMGTLGLMLVIDGQEALISQSLEHIEARASWTRNPLITFIVEQHMRIDMHLPRITALIGDRILDVLDAPYRDLFAPLLNKL